MIEVLSTGPLALFQDRGRFGYASLGVGSSGCFDRMSAARANHAVGNSPHAPVIEVVFGGFSFRTFERADIIVTGIDAPVTVHTSTGVKKFYTNSIIHLTPGDQVHIGAAEYGLRAYLAIRGGFAPHHTLGSASTDVLAHIGPDPIQANDVIPTTKEFIQEEPWWPLLSSIPPLWRRMPTETLRVMPGPRRDWFDDRAWELLLSQEYTVSATSNRIGLRLEASTPLERRISQELPSEGMVRGAIQVPPNGMPVVFGPDHPVTGGYPVIAVLTERSCDRSAQLPPGAKVRFKL
ncbi:MAG: biotin-dependent carboxyltransferase family protein [Corynebacterium sp.]|uniref:5-oxoprolinase subunit C family protein n=1 Tax=Corynebacterium sp. TaxID=1720 RepID=UPI0026DCEEC8|nr:biotin-dependent carboxyltransferase family protein [Corynebacterium sp.]MDO4760677.1 biotin-dependent carboxyltransferase family protein [Corynebacterium sp.]